LGLVRFVEPESGTPVVVNTRERMVRERFEREVRSEREARTHLLRRVAIDEIAVRTDRSYTEALLRFFRGRETRIRRR
jgi:hypothetical protein